MRSLIAPLYLIVSVVLSYFSALGLTVLVFIKAAGQPGLTFILPFLLFMFLLALGEDYNILVMTRIREEAHHLPLREAVGRALSVTGTTVTSAGLVLAGTFGVLAIVGSGSAGAQNVRTIVDVGVGLALGVLMDTFLVRTLLGAGGGGADRAVELVAVRAVPGAAGRPAARRDRGCRLYNV